MADPTRSPRDRILRAIRRGAGLGALAAAAAAALYLALVVVWPGPAFAPGQLRTLVSRESTVTYRDGTRLGVFFDTEHRRYVPFDELPVGWVAGIVAAEDDSFWTHFGVAPRGIVRALRDDLVAMRVVAGGSTLTQQTAKNLFDRPDRSLGAKAIELLDTLRLERWFDKSTILELYANQFHVTSNGRGIGIGARHFFDREVGELTLAQCAFLAGAVKGPARYDPFVAQDGEARAEAIVRATARTRYVLQRIVDEDPATIAGPLPVAAVAKVRDEARTLLADGFDLEFTRGAFRYDDSVALAEVARRLREPPFDALLGHAGIDDPRNAGITVVTTLDPVAQRAATWGLWHHLTVVGTRLESLGAEAYRSDGPGPRFDPDHGPQVHEFRVARVTGHPGDPGKRELALDLGGFACRVDRDGLARVAAASAPGASGSTSTKVSAAEIDAWAAAIPDDAVVLASVRGRRRAEWLCDLEVRPALQGAVAVVQDGELRAIVGGNDNRAFDRVRAPRQLGSTWKALVYAAALELGWSPVDGLDNVRTAFPLGGAVYLPDPDHAPIPTVSVAWAGAKSENLASVWLLYHLLDRLDRDALDEQIAASGLGRGAESAAAYGARLRALGLGWSDDRVDEARWFDARARVLRSLRAGAGPAHHPEDALPLLTMSWGRGFGTERKRGPDPETRHALDGAWPTLDARRAGCRDQYGALVDALRDGEYPAPAAVPDLAARTGPDGSLELACGPRPPGFAALVDRSQPSGIAVPPWNGVFPTAGDLVLWRVHLSTLDAVADAIADLPPVPDPPPEPYDPEVLARLPEFRAMVALRSVVAVARRYGVQSEIREVLPLALGASEITLEEATALYEGLATGIVHDAPGKTPTGRTPAVPTPTSLIREIRDVDGRVLFRSDPVARTVGDRPTADLTADILRGVVLHGTGTRAATAIRHGEQWLPVGGKTGTTNEYRNAAFLGFVPVGSPEGYAIAGGWFVGVYVGYDDNRPMVNRKIKLAGASGALPAWISTADGLALGGLLGDPPTAVPGPDGWPILTDPTVGREPVDEATGLPSPDGAATAAVLGGSLPSAPPPDSVDSGDQRADGVADGAGEPAGVLVAIDRVGNDQQLERRFRLDRSTVVRIAAVGERDVRQMADGAWITDRTGRRV
ncbi:MAG: transglycosylase domain-containing protein, partial [Myxococcota bacterium]